MELRMGPLFASFSWAGAEFLAVSLVVTFVVSRLLLWLAKGVSDRFARNARRTLVSNKISKGKWKGMANPNPNLLHFEQGDVT